MDSFLDLIVQATPARAPPQEAEDEVGIVRLWGLIVRCIHLYRPINLQ